MCIKGRIKNTYTHLDRMIVREGQENRTANWLQYNTSKLDIYVITIHTMFIDNAFLKIVVVPSNVTFWISFMLGFPGTSLIYSLTVLLIHPSAPTMIGIVFVFVFHNF